jgi:hypothetical protein
MLRARSLGSRSLGLCLAASGLCVMLAGCEGVSAINTSYNGSYSGGEWHGQDLPVVVRGAPFAAPPAELDQAIRDALHGTTWGEETRFVAAPNGSTATYRVVFLFNPPAGIASTGLCTHPEPPNALSGAASGPRVETLAALCRGDTAISTADGMVATAGGPGNSEFRDTVTQFGLGLFPQRNPQKTQGSSHR